MEEILRPNHNNLMKLVEELHMLISDLLMTEAVISTLRDRPSLLYKLNIGRSDYQFSHWIMDITKQ